MTDVTKPAFKNLVNIQKRDGRLVPFEFDKITHVILKAMLNSGEAGTNDLANNIALKVARALSKLVKENKVVPTVEGCQDEVERQLMDAGLTATAKHYILYRAKRTTLREKTGEVPAHVRALAEESAKYFVDNPMGEFVYLRSYSRWIEAEGRRETWIETVDRYIDFMRENLGDKLREDEYAELRQAILIQETMPSMRAMQFAGDAARRCHSCLYNCCFDAPTELRDFAETLYLSMMGVGSGFASESYNIEQLPQIKRQTGVVDDTHIVADSKEGWCEAMVVGLTTWFKGHDIEFAYHLVRNAGSRLKTMGGRASGPEPLKAMLAFMRSRILSRQGKRLRNIDAHDFECMVGECAVAGGVRRTALIGLSDLDDHEIRDAKTGQFFINFNHRRVANNSAVYETKPTSAELLEEFTALIKSGTGERGIFNRQSAFSTMPKRRSDFLKKKYGKRFRFIQLGTNPCGEIILQPKEFCNLSEVIGRNEDTFSSLMRKQRLSVILGTYQSTLTNFSFLSPEWKKNCDEERLLGASVTGQWDCPAFRDADVMKSMLQLAISTNIEYAERFGINPSLAITAVKPSGTVSQTFNCSSGMHARYAPFYIRRIRISATDSLFKLMRDQGVPYNPEVGQTMEDATTFVIDFPVKSPEGARCRNDFTALEQLDYWKMVKLNYTEHNPSVTISVGEDEWIGVVNWLDLNWDIAGGLAFLPRDNHVYQLAPYEEIDEATYIKLAAEFPKVDYAKLCLYEKVDETDNKRELACSGGSCEIN